MTLLGCTNAPPEFRWPTCEEFYSQEFCADGGNRVVLVDETITGANRQAVQAGFDAWTNKTLGIVKYHVKFVPRSELQDDQLTLKPRTTYVWSRDPADPMLDGEAVWNPWTKSGSISIPPGTPTDYYKVVTMHEAGHTLNLNHYEDGEPAVMSITHLSWELTCVDIRLFCSEWNCNIPCADDTSHAIELIPTSIRL